jgi:hypothetical protein
MIAFSILAQNTPFWWFLVLSRPRTGNAPKLITVYCLFRPPNRKPAENRSPPAQPTWPKNRASLASSAETQPKLAACVRRRKVTASEHDAKAILPEPRSVKKTNSYQFKPRNSTRSEAADDVITKPSAKYLEAYKKLQRRKRYKIL